jgi:iron complex outermembrane receptor protein
VHAADGRLSYRIPTGSLNDALREFVQQSGTQLLYSPELTAHRRSKGIEGHFSPARALALLLRDSGLQAEAVAPGTYVLQRVRQAAPHMARVRQIPAEYHPTELGSIEVTGTHIRRTVLETAAPLTVIDRAQIEHSGYQTLFELLRSQPGIRVNSTPVAMTDGTAFQNNGLSGAIGAAAVDLHGLGPTATLFLIDGQRMAGYGLAQGEFGLVNDLDSIPLALIERIEVLRDGASAVYGSDAMAGVINIILRKQFNGAALDGNTGISAHGDARQHRTTATFGTTTVGGGHLLLSLDDLQRQRRTQTPTSFTSTTARSTMRVDSPAPSSCRMARAVPMQPARPACRPGWKAAPSWVISISPSANSHCTWASAGRCFASTSKWHRQRNSCCSATPARSEVPGN